VLVLPLYFGLDGVWYAFPISDVLAVAVTYGYLRYELKRDKDLQLEQVSATAK
jgi:Na+-driven multidrug efflux pump